MIEYLKKRAPLFGVGLFFVLFLLMRCFVSLSTHVVSNKSLALHYNYKIFWGLSVVLLVITLCWSSINSISLINKYAKNKKKVFLFLAFIILFYLIMLQDTFNDALKLSGRAGEELQKLILLNPKINLKMVDVTGVINILVFISISLLTYSLTVLLLSFDNDITIKLEKIREIRNSLYSSSALLVIGVINIAILYNWSVHSSINNNNSITALGIIAASGVFYSAIMAILYIPIFIRRDNLLNEHIKHLNFETKGEIDNWLNVHNIKVGVKNTFKELFVILSPILTSGIIQIL